MSVLSTKLRWNYTAHSRVADEGCANSPENSFDVIEENQLYQQGGAILSYLPANLENPWFVHLLSKFYSPPFKSPFKFLSNYDWV